MTAVARPPRPLLPATAVAGASTAPAAHARPATPGYAGRHRAAHRRARHPHAAAAMIAIMLAWIPAAGAGRGRHRRH